MVSSRQAKCEGNMELLESYDGLGLARLVAAGEVTAADLLAQSIARANRYNPALNAIIHRFDERALTLLPSPASKGHFVGVPFLLKDLTHDFAGEPTTLGSRGIRLVPERHSELVRRYLAAGLVPFGKTNTPEMGLTITTEPKAHGPVHNPWLRGYSAGGSSGGAAAAVAARIVPVASASDGGGSIRFPSACCGVFGLKPSRGRVPNGPEQGEGWNGAVASHVISLSVRDSAALLDATAGDELGAPFHLPPPATSWLAASQRDPGRLRIGYSSSPMIRASLDAEALRGLDNTVTLLRELGHEVEQADPAHDADQLWRDFITVVFANTAALVSWVSNLGPHVRRSLEPATVSMARIGHAISAEQLVEAQQGWHQLRLSMGQYFERYDVLLTPTLIGPPQAHGVLTPSRVEELLQRIVNHLPVAGLLYRSSLLEEMMMPVLSQMAFTVMANMTGLPSMSVPLHWTEAGLPLGMQFTGRMCDEETLYSLAGQLEQARPWFDRRPPLLAS
jgi:amidase